MPPPHNRRARTYTLILRRQVPLQRRVGIDVGAEEADDVGALGVVPDLLPCTPPLPLLAEAPTNAAISGPGKIYSLLVSHTN